MRRLLVLALAIAVPACGNDSPSAPATTTTTLPAQSAISVSIDPSPIIAGPSSNPNFQFALSFRVTVRETAGLAANVNFVNWTMRNATTGVELNTLAWNPDEITTRAGSNHVPANGSLTIPLNIVYTLAGGGRQAQATIAVQVIDARSNRVNASTTAQVLGARFAELP